MNAERRQNHLAALFRKHRGRCAICGCCVEIMPPMKHGERPKPHRAVRFRKGSGYGEPGRVRPRVLACWACAQNRSREITLSQPIEELRWRAGREQTEFYELPVLRDR